MIRLLALVLAASLAEANETLVLKDGNRMEVVSYEIRGNLLVVTTLDGELRSLPASLFDLEATERANKPVASGERLPQARLDKTRQLLELYGTLEVLELLCAQFEELATAELEEDAPVRYHVPFIEASRRTFSVARIFEVTIAHFAENATEAELDAWIADLDTAPFERIIALEKASSSLQGIDAKQRYREEMTSSSVTPERRTVVERIENAGVGAELGADAYITMFRTWEDVARKIFPRAETHDLEAFRDHLVRQGREDITGGLAIYHTAELADLLEYARFLESPEGQRFLELFRRACTAGLEAAHRETVRAWLEAAARL